MAAYLPIDQHVQILSNYMKNVDRGEIPAIRKNSEGKNTLVSVPKEEQLLFKTLFKPFTPRETRAEVMVDKEVKGFVHHG